MRVRLLGPLELDPAGPALGPRDRVVLSALAMRIGRPVTAEQLADALWGGRPPASWAKVVQGCVSRLRQGLGSEAIATTASGYRLESALVEVDRDAFDDLVARAREQADTGSPERAASLLVEALALWRGQPFDALEEWEPGRLEVSRLIESRRTAEEDLLQARLDAGKHRQVAEEGTVMVGEEPWRERRWAILALAQYRCGRQADALATIRTARRQLDRELGLEPGSDLVDLERRILAQDPALAAEHEARVAALDCPWRGLAPYRPEDHDSFYGRAAEVRTLLDRLGDTRLLVLAGPSGSGKSSLMNAGIAPALGRRDRDWVAFSPGMDGRAAMTVALAGAGPDPVLLVDQFEEAFTLADPAPAAAWLAELATYAHERGPVVVTVRADQLVHLTLDGDFARLAEAGMYLVAPLTGTQLRSVIEEPAEQVGLRLEHGLADLVLRDAEDQPGALPLLSHALTQTWQRRVDGLLTVEGYRASGGIRGAVAASADRLYESLSPDEREQLRALLLRMVLLGDNDEPVRTGLSPAFLTEDRRKVMDLLVRARLVTSGANGYEIAHESLVRAWPKLRAWLDEDRVGQRIARHLATTASGWEALGRPETELYRGSRLVAALEWRSHADVDLTPLERAFLDASEELAYREQHRREQEVQRQRSQNQRLRVLLVGAAVMLVVAVGAGAVALDRESAARHERDAAREAEQAFRHEALVGRSLSLRSTNRGVAALLAVEAYRQRPDVLAVSALLGTFTASPGFLGYRYLDGGEGLQAAAIPRTLRAVVAGEGGHLGVLDIATGAIRHPFGPPIPNAQNSSVLRVSEDGNRVAQLLLGLNDPGRCGYVESLSDDDGRGCSMLLVHDIDTGKRVLGPVVIPFEGGDLAINVTGEIVAVAGGYGGDVATYDVPSERLLGRRAGPPRPAGVFLRRDTAAVAFDAFDNLFVGSMAGEIRELDARTLRTIRTIAAPRLSSHNNLVVAEPGFLVASGDQAMLAIDLRTGRRLWSADLRDEPTPDPCPFLALPGDFGRSYCVNHSGQMEERFLANGQRSGTRLDAQMGSVSDLIVSGTGRPELVAFGAHDHVYAQWRLDGAGLLARLVTESKSSPIGYDPSGRYLAKRQGPRLLEVVHAEDGAGVVTVSVGRRVAWAAPGTLAYWGPSGGELLDVESQRTRQVPGLDSATEAVFADPDGTHAWVTTSRSGGTLVRRIGLATAQLPAIAMTVPGSVQSISVAPDQRVLITYAGPKDWQTRIYDVATGRLLAFGLPGQLRTAVSADGHLVAADATGNVTEFDPETLEPLASLPGARAAPSSLQFDDAGERLLITSADQQVQVYDMATRSRLGEPIPAAAKNGLVEGWLRPDGQVIAVNGPRGVLEWTLDPERAVQAACVLAGRNLTRAEWATYLGPDEPYRPTCPDLSTGS